MNNPLIEQKDPILLRIVYTILFYCIFYLAELAVVIIAIIQTCYVVLSGAPQADIKNFSMQLSTYLRQLVSYMTWATDKKPYPFVEWPRNASEQKQE